MLNLLSTSRKPLRREHEERLVLMAEAKTNTKVQ